MNNVGYLKASKNNDECYTPHYAVHPLIKYIPSNKTIWCPFDESWSAFVNELFLNGNKVISSHLNEGLDFFNYEPYYYDIIISNPPFFIKDAVLKRLYELNKPFASAYFCRDLLPKDLIIEHLNKYDEALNITACKTIDNSNNRIVCKSVYIKK